MFKTIEWTDEGVRMIDQTRLPAEEVYRTCRDYEEVAEAIRSMVIRGAPAIGVAAAMGSRWGSRTPAPGPFLRCDRILTDRGNAFPHPPHRRQSLLGHRPNAQGVRGFPLLSQHRRAGSGSGQSQSRGGSETHPCRRHRDQRGHGPARRCPPAGFGERSLPIAMRALWPRAVTARLWA